MGRSVGRFDSRVIAVLASLLFNFLMADGTAADSLDTPTVADMAYGSVSERQKLDFWKPDSDKPTPVVLMIHGGGWIRGDKNISTRRRSVLT